MSFDTDENSMFTNIKIEIEKVPADATRNEDNAKSTHLNCTDVSINNNLTVTKNLSDDNVISNNQVKAIEGITNQCMDKGLSFKNTLESDQMPAGAIISISKHNQGESSNQRNSPSMEVPITEVRYFKCIGKSDIGNGTCELYDKNFSNSAGYGQPLTASPRSLKASIDDAGNSNDSHFTNYKPLSYKDIKYGKVELYAPITGPRIYNVKGNIISKPIITKNLPEAFRAQPVYGRSESKAGLDEFYDQKIRDYVGCGITDDEYKRHKEYLNPEYLRTGFECSTSYLFPTHGSLSTDLKTNREENGPGQHLCLVKKLKLRVMKDIQNHYPRKLKYRGLRMLPLSLWDENHIKEPPEQRLTIDAAAEALEPGRDIIYRVRVYRPYAYGGKEPKPARHSVFNNDIVLVGRQRLTALRDRLTCANDVGMRVDVSDQPESFTTQSAKELFPSGFLFINNVFYVDTRPGCRDMSAGVRAWARRRRLGAFPVRDMSAVRLQHLTLRLGHPEVYMHQGKCEHLFTFSEVRLLSPTDPPRLSCYPCYTQISQNQSVYCTTCAEFGAKWIVVGCTRVPFDPAFFCDTCLRFYLYDHQGNKIGDFKAYSYKGNTVNFMRPVVSNHNVGESTNSDHGDDGGD